MYIYIYIYIYIYNHPTPHYEQGATQGHFKVVYWWFKFKDVLFLGWFSDLLLFIYNSCGEQIASYLIRLGEVKEIDF